MVKRTFWIARDKSESLYIYRTKPHRDKDWFSGYESIKLAKDSFKEITWENSPQRVSITITL